MSVILESDSRHDEYSIINPELQLLFRCSLSFFSNRPDLFLHKSTLTRTFTQLNKKTCSVVSSPVKYVSDFDCGAYPTTKET